jgi:pyrrolidone-carboxylate peptidase
MEKMNLKVKGPTKTHTFLGLDSSLTMRELQVMIAKECDVSVDEQILKFGQLKRDTYIFDTLIAKENDILSSLFKTGDFLLLERKSSQNIMENSQNERFNKDQIYFLKYRGDNLEKRDTIIKYHITSFGPFHGVSDNPSSNIVKRFEKMEDSDFANLGLKPGSYINSLSVVETSGVGVKEYITKRNKHEPFEKHVYLHLGVHGGAKAFHLEKIGWNEADFSCPDERNWRPSSQPIFSKETSPGFETKIKLDQICPALKQKGYSCLISDDPGRFICNYMYCSSLYDCCANEETYCLFVHIPPFDIFPVETQMKFVIDLLNEITDTLV